MDSPGTSHDESAGDLNEVVYQALRLLREGDWSALLEPDDQDAQGDEATSEPSLRQLRDTAVNAVAALLDHVQERMYT